MLATTQWGRPDRHGRGKSKWIRKLYQVITNQKKAAIATLTSDNIVFIYFLNGLQVHRVWLIIILKLITCSCLSHFWLVIFNVCVHAQSLSYVWFLVILWTTACQSPLSMGFSRQEYCSGLPFPPLGDLPDPGIELVSPALAGGFFYHWAT